MNHWCDGFAVLFKFRINGNKVTFMKKYLDSEAYQKAQTIGKPVFTEFATPAYSDGSKSIFRKIVSSVVPDLTDNDINIVYILNGTAYAATETSVLRSINLDTLETGVKVDMTKWFTGFNICCSHIHKDENYYYSLGVTFTTGFKYNIVRTPRMEKDKEAEPFRMSNIFCTFGSRWKTYIGYTHSFGMTENWIIFIEQPLLMDGFQLLAVQMKGKTLKECMDWQPSELNRFVLIDKATGKVCATKYYSEKSFFFFHYVNAYEEDNQIVIDVLAHDSPEVLDQMYLKNLRDSKFNLKDKTVCKRFVIPLIEGKLKNYAEGENMCTIDMRASAERMNDSVVLKGATIAGPAFELPTINKSYLGGKYQYFYATGLYDKSPYKSQVVKVNVTEGTVVSWKGDEHMYPGEVDFIPNPGSTAEDDGILLSCVSDVRPDKEDFLLILDATSLKEIARASVNSHIPLAMHGLYNPDK